MGRVLVSVLIGLFTLCMFTACTDATPDAVNTYEESESTPADVDGDGIPNIEDTDMDGDDIPNTQDDDMDGDGIANIDDNDMDSDGIANIDDNDMDGDGVVNTRDDDMDGDGAANSQDDDMDGDGVVNIDDNDMDGDGVANGDDVDIDGDGIDNVDDNDIDGDGIANIDDNDIDGDGIANEEDNDIDGDGIANDQDSDMDGDGYNNEDDADIDGDGIANSEDPDIDNDGITNADDPAPGGTAGTPTTGTGGKTNTGGDTNSGTTNSGEDQNTGATNTGADVNDGQTSGSTQPASEGLVIAAVDTFEFSFNVGAINAHRVSASEIIDLSDIHGQIEENGIDFATVTVSDFSASANDAAGNFIASNQDARCVLMIYYIDEFDNRIKIVTTPPENSVVYPPITIGDLEDGLSSSREIFMTENFDRFADIVRDESAASVELMGEIRFIDPVNDTGGELEMKFVLETRGKKKV